MRISVRQLDSHEDGYRVVSESDTYEDPSIPVVSPQEYRASFHGGFPGMKIEYWGAWLDGEIAGLIRIVLPLHDNLGLIMARPIVRPTMRRQGAGRALLAKAIERAREEGRDHLTAGTMDLRPDGELFAAAMGAKPALENLASRLDLTAVDEGALAELRRQADERATGYRLATWSGSTPDELIEGVAYLESRMNSDAPTGDLALEAETIDADRMRQREELQARRGRLLIQAGALHGDRLVAWTEINGNPANHTHAWQSTTLVDPEHRGHRLGLLVKLANLDQARTLLPGLHLIDTQNAASNEHMLRINRAMGFQVVAKAIDWQLDL